MIKKFFEKYYWIVFSGIALLLIYPSFVSGYIFALDWVIKPFIAWSDIVWTDPVGWIVCDIFSIVLSFAVFQRILLFAIIVLAGTAGFRLAKETHNIFAQYFSGLFLIFNPFFYARLLEQTMLIGGGMVAFFWFWVFFMEALKRMSMRKMIYAALCASLAISFFAHSIFFIFSVFVAMIIAHYIKMKDWKYILKTTLLFWGLVFAINSNWIIASFAHGNTWASKVENFTYDDIDAFHTQKIGGHSVYMTVLALQGYWGEYQDRFVSIQDNPLWVVGFLGIFALAIYGIMYMGKGQYLAKPFFALFLMAFVLAIGIASPLFKPYVLLLYKYVPFYIGLREPQKWVMVMVFVYAYTSAWGIARFMSLQKIQKYHLECGVLIIALPIVFSFYMITGVHTYITPRDFPVSWHTVRDHVQEDHSNGKILFFPWHAYVHCDFAQKNIINPSKQYFGPRIISGNNVEFGKVYSNFTDPQTTIVQKYVQKDERNARTFVQDLQAIDVQTIIVAKIEDWQNYQWIDEVRGMTKVMENEDLIVYHVGKAQ